MPDKLISAVRHQKTNKEFDLMMKKTLALGIIIAFMALTPVPAFATGSGGYENASFSAKQLALGGTGTATPDEAAAISYNPAGIADLPGVQVQADANFISLMTFKDNDQTGSTRSSGTLALVPTGYVTVNPGKMFCDKLALGVGMDSPFGLMNKYNSNDPAVHYTGWRNELKMYAIKPTIAYKVTDKISVGGGPVYYRIDDFGSIQGYPNSLIVGGLPDGQMRANMSGNRWGWQLGTLLKLTPKHRLGYYVRGPVVVKARGQVKVEGASTLWGPSDFETGVHTKVNLPMNMTWAYAFQPTEKTHYEADFTWTHWSVHKRLRVPADPAPGVWNNTILDGVGNSSGSDKDWRDGYGLQLGASHKLTKNLTLRGGSWFYWTPIPKDHFTPAVPDANHLALSMGAGYNINKYLVLDLCYYNSFYFRRRINNSIAENPSLSNSSVDGTYTTYSQGFTISLTLKWDDLFPRVGGKVDEGPSIEMPKVA